LFSVEPIPIRYTDAFKQERARREMNDLLRKRRTYPIAPDGSRMICFHCRKIFTFNFSSNSKFKLSNGVQTENRQTNWTKSISTSSG